jgi:hypothetical protein
MEDGLKNDSPFLVAPDSDYHEIELYTVQN